MADAAHASNAPAVSLPSWRARYRQRLFRTDPADADRVVLRHGRIYILPTRRGVAFLGALTMTLLTSLNYSLALGFVATFLCAGLAAAGLLHTFRNLNGIELRPFAAGETFAGSTLPFRISLEGHAIARHAVTLAARGCAPVTVDVTPDAALPVTLELYTPRRGSIVLGRITLSSQYPLGLWRAWVYVHFPVSGIAFPAPEASAPPLPFGASGEDARDGAKGTETDLAGLRSYQPGDPLQRVAWKAVARGAGWYTKQFEGGGSGGGPVELDWASVADVPGFEARISRLTAWVLAAERIARPFALTIPGFRLPAGQGREHRRKALTALALASEPPQ
jgi:uncharacterized protein (DUF58 family)